MGERWRVDGVHKWIAHDRATGELVGRGGLSRTELDGAHHLEVGWAVRTPLWGCGYATEMGAEALRFAADVLGATEVVASLRGRRVGPARLTGRPCTSCGVRAHGRRCAR
jgi:RimJ/RimL family protein N-acetyltransferase